MINSDLCIELNYKAIKLREKFGYDESSPIDIFSIAFDIPELTLVFCDLGDNLSGICYKYDKVIAINSSHSYGRCRFTLAHEFYHYYIEDNNNQVVCSISLSNNQSKNDKIADMFASFFLAPIKAFKDKTSNLTKEDIKEVDIIRLEQYFGMSRLAILYRLKMEKLIDNDWDKYTKNVILNAKKYGFDDNLYLKTSFGNKTFGKYLSLINELKEKDLISRGKEIELLLTAYRDDLIEGENGNSDSID